MTQLSEVAPTQRADWPLPPGLAAVAVHLPPDGTGPDWAAPLDRAGLDEFDLASQALYRQTLVLLGDRTNLESLVRYVSAERPPLKAWLNNLEALRPAVVAFQQLQQNKGSRDDLKKQFQQMDQIWEKVMAQFRVSGQDQFLLIQQAARVDQVLGRIARLVGIDNRRPPLTDPWS